MNFAEMKARRRAQHLQPQRNQVERPAAREFGFDTIVNEQMHRVEDDPILVTTRHRDDSCPAERRLNPGRLFEGGWHPVRPVDDDAGEDPIWLRGLTEHDSA